MQSFGHVTNTHIHTVGNLHFIIEPSWMQRFTSDVIFWEAGESIQHHHTIGIEGELPDLVEHATWLATEYQSIILTMIADRRDAALSQDRRAA